MLYSMKVNRVKLAVFKQRNIQNLNDFTKLYKIVKYKTTLKNLVALLHTSKLPEKETKYKLSYTIATNPSGMNFTKMWTFSLKIVALIKEMEDNRQKDILCAWTEIISIFTVHATKSHLQIHRNSYQISKYFFW